MNLTAPQKNALHGLDMLLNLSNVRVTRTTLREKLWQHPDFPSLISLSDTLDELKVDNMAARLTTDELPEIPLPALAYLNSEGGLFVPVRAIAAGAVEWWHNQRGWQTESLTEFNQKWDGITLLIEPTEQSGEADYANSRKKQTVKRLQLPFVVISLLTCLGVWTGAYHTPLAAALPYYALVLVYTAGLAVSGLLVWYGLDADNPFLRSICQLSSRTTCSAVLNTSAAKLFSWLSWAEVGLFYFGGGLLALLFFRTNTAALYPLLLGLSVAALPYTFWSVYYQWHRARQWCVLCLTVQVLLWVGFGLLLYFHPRPFWPAGFGGPEIALLISSFLPIPILWTLLKPIWSSALHTDSLQRSLQKVKFDPGYIESLSQHARVLPPIFTEMRVPTLGNPDATDTLTIVTNPTCSKCARVHAEIETLMTGLKDVRCQFVIAVSRRRGDMGGAVAGYVFNQAPEEMHLVLHEWYAAPHKQNWFKKVVLPNLIINNDIQTQINLHQRWCELAGLNTVPSIFFNNVRIPQYYTIAEISKVINLLKEGVAKPIYA